MLRKLTVLWNIIKICIQLKLEFSIMTAIKIIESRGRKECGNWWIDIVNKSKDIESGSIIEFDWIILMSCKSKEVSIGCLYCLNPENPLKLLQHI